MIDWPVDLISDIARRKCVLFLGAGVSKNSVNAVGARPKNWLEFLTSAAAGRLNEKVIRNLIKSSDYLTACEVIKVDLGRDDFNTLVKNEFLTPQFLSAEIHEHIYNLDSRIVATPNFDKIYDVYAQHASHGSNLVKTYYDDDVADCIRRVEPVILKIHGTIDASDHLIFSRKDYAEARIKHKDFYTVLEALAITHTFIFIGCGVNDPDIRLLLEDYFFKYKLTRKHYFITPKNSVKPAVLKIIEDTMNLKALIYDPKNNHKELGDSLGNLVSKVDLKREELADTMKW